MKTPRNKPATGAVSGGVRRWEQKVFRPWWTADGKRVESSTYSIRLAHNGTRRTVNLLTPDQREAGRRAQRFAAMLTTQGWAGALADLSPEQARVEEQRSEVKVGDVIRAAGELALHVRPVTLKGYAVSLRWLASRIAEQERGVAPAAHRHRGKGWKEKADAVPLKMLTTRSIEGAVLGYRRARGNTQEAARTAASFVRLARGYFSKRMRRVYPFEVGDPFAGAMIEKPRPPRYVSMFDVGELVEAARTELRERDPAAWLAFVLIMSAGLRKAEADALQWSNVDTANARLRIVTTVKNVESFATVDISPEVCAELEVARADAGSLYVIPDEPRKRATLRKSNAPAYRAKPVWTRLTRWLRAHGVTAQKPCHTLRKESGSLVNAEHGIFAASRFLRHADVKTTADFYADARKRVVVGVFGAKKSATA